MNLDVSFILLWSIFTSIASHCFADILVFCRNSTQLIASQVKMNLNLQHHSADMPQSLQLVQCSNTSMNVWIYASKSKLSKELKNGIETLVDKTVFKLWIKTVKILLGSITQELLGLLKFQCYFWVPWAIYYKLHISFFQKVLTILR